MTRDESSSGGGSGVVLGNPVTGDDFVGRTAEMEELQRHLAAGTHLHVTAPRRIGKTSLLLEARRRLDGKGTFLFVDVQGCESEPDAIAKLVCEARGHNKLGAKILDVFKGLSHAAERVEEIDISSLRLRLRDRLTADWRGKADDVLARLASDDTPTVIWFDELPLLVANLLDSDERGETPARKSRTRAFLSWLREASVRHANRICFVLSGSVGLKPLLERAGLSDTLNTFLPFPLGPWSREEALLFLGDRAKRHGFSWVDGSDGVVLERIRQPIPFHVQTLFHEIARDARRRETDTVNRADVERVSSGISGSTTARIDLSTYEERLRRIVSPDWLPVAQNLLTEAAVGGGLSPDAAATIVAAADPNRPSASAQLRFLLSVFEHDGYLERVEDQYVFSSNLLRDWWRHRFGFGYRPVSSSAK